MNAAADPALQAAERELQTLRGRLATTVAFIHDPAYDLTARQALAQRLNLPEPRTYTPRTEPTHG